MDTWDGLAKLRHSILQMIKLLVCLVLEDEEDTGWTKTLAEEAERGFIDCDGDSLIENCYRWCQCHRMQIHHGTPQ